MLCRPRVIADAWRCARRGLSVGSEPLWTPSRQRVEASQLSTFADRVAARSGGGAAAAAAALLAPGFGGRDAEAYARLHRWSVEAPGAFWAEAWDFLDVQSAARWDSGAADGGDGGAAGGGAVVPPDARWFADAVVAAPGGRALPGPVWFRGALVNHAENLLSQGADGAPALIFYSEVRGV